MKGSGLVEDGCLIFLYVFFRVFEAVNPPRVRFLLSDRESTAQQREINLLGKQAGCSMMFHEISILNNQLQLLFKSQR